MLDVIRCAAVGTLAVAACALPLREAQSNIVVARGVELADLSLEQLANIVVTSASRREERLAAAPASIYVISADDIRRSGVTTYRRRCASRRICRSRAPTPTSTRSARAASTTCRQQAARADRRAHRLHAALLGRVLGRARRPARGHRAHRGDQRPGRDAVGRERRNGVINSSRPARTTQGALVTGARQPRARRRRRATAASSAQRPLPRLRQVLDARRPELDRRPTDRDGSEPAQAGFRVDWGATRRSRCRATSTAAISSRPRRWRDLAGVNVLARWRRARQTARASAVQAYYDRTSAISRATFREELDIFDVEFQHGFGRERAHAAVGAGYRHARDHIDNIAPAAFLPAGKTLDWGTCSRRTRSRSRRCSTSRWA